MPRVHLTTLGCARNDVDSDELTARLAAAGWDVDAEQDAADVIVVNTCGFIASAKKDSIDTILAATDSGAPVVVTGCLAERYGRELAVELPEAAAVLGFDQYAHLPEVLSSVLAGEVPTPHEPQDRRHLLPISPVERDAQGTPGTSGLTRRVTGPIVPVKIASGCDRRCTFCAIPAFRGSFVSRRPTDVIAEIVQVVADGAREVFLVSENSTSYGKDLGDIRLLESLLPAIGSIDGLTRARVSYLQPAEMRPGVIEVVAATPGIAPYFDLSFQHASGPVLRRMRRFGDAEAFLDLIERARRINPSAGFRSNVIVGFPGETEADVEILMDFLERARLDAIGVFAYSDEDGTEAVRLDEHVPEDVIADRCARVTTLTEELMWQRAEERIGEMSSVIVEAVLDGHVEGRAAHQGPEDALTVWDLDEVDQASAEVGDVIEVEFVGVEGVDLIGRPR
jgi:ribosomal protein S12 methylthiotransferase RimO